MSLPHTDAAESATSSSRVEPDLTGWLGGHSLMRRQFGLLAEAAGEVAADDAARIEALEDHLAFMHRRLDWHHHHEDADVFPALRAGDDALADLIDDLEQDHARLEELLVVTGDREVALPRRASALRDLSRELGAHLDREETEAVPAIRRIIPAAAWALGDQQFLDELGADRATTLTWMASHLPPEARADFLARLPLPARELYRTVWRPQHLQKVRLMYGAEVASTA
jgi:iron-sulfur cluster repair protein YtfE (RIC family)